MAAGQYTIRVHGVLDDTQILARLASIQKQMGAVPIGGKGGKGVAAIGTAADGSAKKVKRLNTAVGTTAKNVKKVGSPAYAGSIAGLGRSAKQSENNFKKFGSTTLDVTKKVVQFGAVTAVIRGVTSGMGAMVQNVFDLDSALTEFKKVSDLSGKSLEKYTDQAYKVGSAVAKTGVEMVEAATEFRKAGYNDQDALRLGKIASMYQNVADQELTAGEAANFITSQMKAYNIEAKDAEHIIDAVNEVSNNFAVSSADIATNIGKASAALAQGNITYEESIGLMTAMTEITRNGSTAARGLVSIQSRFNQITDETSSTGKKLTAWYEKHNIAIRDQNGNLRSFFEVGKDVSKIWNDLSKDEQMYYLNTQAGANQSRNLAALMRNYSTAIEATETALNSEGSAARENAKYMDSLQGRLQALKSAWSQFANATLKSDTVKVALEGLTKALQFMASDAGQGLLKAAAGVTAFFGAFKLAKGIGSAVSGVTKLSKGAEAAGDSLRVLQMAQLGSTKQSTKLARALSKIAPMVPMLGALGAAAAVVGYGVYEAYKSTHKYRLEVDNLEASNKKSITTINENAEEAKRLTERIDELSKVENKTNREKALMAAYVEHLNELYPDLNLQYDKEKDKLNQTTDSIYKYIEAKKEEAKAAAYEKNFEKALNKQIKLEGKRADAQKELDRAQKQYNKEVESGYVNDMTIKRLQKAKAEVKDLNVAYAEITKEVTKQSNNMVKNSDAWKDLKKKADEAGVSMSKGLKDAINEGVYAIPESLKDLKSLISFDDIAQGLSLSSDGRELVESLQQGMREGHLDINDALNIATQMDEMRGKLNSEGSAAVADLAQQFSSGEIDFSEFQKKLQSVLSNEDYETKYRVDAEVNDEEVENAKSENKEPVSYTATGKGDNSDVKKKKTDDKKPVNYKATGKGDNEDVKKKKKDDKKPVTYKVKGEATGGKSSKSVKATADTSGATSKISGLSKLLSGLKNKAVSIKANVSGKGNVSSLKSDIKNLPSSKTVNIYVKKHGSANIPGQASGTKNAPAGLSEVNEEGFEFIRDAKTGKLRIADGGKRTITYLNKGDIVYTHKESQKMLESEGDVIIPQHKSGTKKKQKAYDKAYKNISNAHERKMKELEYAAQRDHWSDVKLAQAKKAQLDATNKQIAALNSKYGKKITKQSAMDTLDAEFDIKKAQLEAEHDAQTQAVESAISGQLGYTKDLSTVVRQINSSSRLSAEEKQKYLKEAYKENVEYLQKLFDKNKKTYDEMAGTLKSYYDQGMITAKEYYDYLDDLAEKQLDKEKDRISKLNEVKENEYDLAKAYVQYQIDKLEEQNDLIEKQADLEKARTQRVKVYRQGVGFVYEQDTEAIREAEKAIDDLSDSPELKKWKDILELFGDMEALADIKELENKLGKTSGELFGGMGTDLAQWETFIRSNLATTLGYSSLLDAMDELEGHDAIVGWLQGVGETVSESQIQQAIDRNRFASGTLSAPAGFARVAENGYEIALLGKGDAVMPHNVSENLMQWGRYNPVEVMQGGVGGTVENFHFDSLVLPNVTDANGFMRELQNLPNRALQYSRSRG